MHRVHCNNLRGIGQRSTVGTRPARVSYTSRVGLLSAPNKQYADV